MAPLDAEAQAEAGDAGEAWETLLEANPQLGSVRLVLQRRSRGPNAAATASTDHSDWSVRLSMERDTLNLLLDPSGDRDAKSTILVVKVGEGVEVLAESLQTRADHISLTLRPLEMQHWLSDFAGPSQLEDRLESDEVVCRRCRLQLLTPGPRTSLLLPSSMMQSCAEVMACEECSPLGVRHLAAAQGRVYISEQCVIASAIDAPPAALRSGGTSGFVRCGGCNVIVGESEVHAEPTLMKGLGARGKPRRRRFMQDAWGRGSCRSRGVALYKHRISVVDPAEVGGNSNVAPKDALGDVTEVSSVAAQLLALRAAGGVSRFLLLPGPPDGDDGEEVMDEDRVPNDNSQFGAALVAGALELRVVMPDMVLLGPLRHSPRTDALGAVARPWPVQRTSKVYFRRRQCSSTEGFEGQVLTVPPLAFQQVSEVLNTWVDNLPPSHAVSPVVDKDGMGAWLTSCLPQPASDGSVE